jgi:rhamnose transport system permease protein
MNRAIKDHSWELFIGGMVLLAAVWATSLSPYYLNAEQLLFSSRNLVFTGVMGLGLSLVILTGEMDLSLPSILAVCTVLLSKASAAGLPLPVALAGIVLVALALGAINGFLVAALRLPALAVTLGTMGAYRGLAFIIGSEVGYTGFDGRYKWLGEAKIGASSIPVMLIPFALAVLAFMVIMHFSTFGRRCFAIGNNASAASYSGISVVRTKLGAYMIAALMAALGAWVFIGQFGSARGDNANGVILGIITAVVLGGVDINGGRGTILGVLLSTIFLWTLRNGMGLANIAGPIQQLIIGALLVTGVLASNFMGGRIEFAGPRKKAMTGPSAP